MRAKISIIVPLYNQENNIIHCLDSISTQTYNNFECIIVNDGSNDKSGDLVEEYITKDSRFIYTKQQNAGVSAARNSGLRIATGEYIVFIDSDDWVNQRYLEELISPFKNESIQFSIFNSEIKETRNIDIDSLLNNFNEYYDFRIFNTPWGKCYKRKFIDFYFDSELSLGEDLLFNLNYLMKIKSENNFLTYGPSHQYVYVDSINSLSNTVNLNKVMQLLQLLEKLNKFDKFINLYSVFRIQTKSLFRYCIELFKRNNKNENVELFNLIDSIDSNNNTFILLTVLCRLKNYYLRYIYMKLIIMLDYMMKGK